MQLSKLLFQAPVAGELHKGRDESAGRRAGWGWVGLGMPGFPRAREFVGPSGSLNSGGYREQRINESPKGTLQVPTLVGVTGSTL